MTTLCLKEDTSVGMNSSNPGNGSNSNSNSTRWIHHLRKKSTSCPPANVVITGSSKDNETSNTSRVPANSKEINSRRFTIATTDGDAASDDLEVVEEEEVKEMIDGSCEESCRQMDSQFRNVPDDISQSTMKPTLPTSQTNKDHSHLLQEEEEDVFLLEAGHHHHHGQQNHPKQQHLSDTSSMTSHQRSPETLSPSHSMQSASNQSSKQKAAEAAESTANQRLIQQCPSDGPQQHSNSKFRARTTTLWCAF